MFDDATYPTHPGQPVDRAAIIEAARAAGYVPLRDDDTLGRTLDDIIATDLEAAYADVVDSGVAKYVTDDPAHASWVRHQLTEHDGSLDYVDQFAKAAGVVPISFGLLGFETIAQRDAREARAIWERLHPHRARWQAWSRFKRYQAKVKIRDVRNRLAELVGDDLHRDCSY